MLFLAKLNPYREQVQHTTMG